MNGHDDRPTTPQQYPYGSAPGATVTDPGQSAFAQQPYGQQQGDQQHGDPWATPGSAPAQDVAANGAGSGNRGPRRRPGWLAVGGVALASAVAASALTAGLVGAFGTTDSNSTSMSTARVPAPVQGVSETTTNWQAVVDATAPSVVSVAVTSATASGEGSGIVYDTDGHIVTNNHVVSGAGSDGRITVTLNDGREYAATIVGTDPQTDLAVIKLTNGPADLTPATFADSDAVVAGQSVMALGNPLGLAGTATTGIVSAVDRPVSTEAEPSEDSQTPANPYGFPFGGQGQGQVPSAAETAVTNAIQTDAAINPGNSGGALLDTSGRVIGVNSSIASLGTSGGTAQSGNIGVGFAIPSNEVKMIADQLVKSGSAQHAWLGVTLAQQDPTATVNGAGRTGAGILAVTPDTPAAQAGVREGDVITAVDGESVNGAESLTAAIRGKAVGAEVTLTIIRDSQEQTLEATLTARPETTTP